MNKIMVLTLFLALLVGVGSASAVTVVTGVVTDSSASPVLGANVTVTCLSVSASDLTNALGIYSVSFLTVDCPFNTPVSVHAQLGDMQGDAVGITCENSNVCPIPIAVVNVTIPEFGLMGAMLITLAGIGLVAYKRKN